MAEQIFVGRDAEIAILKDNLERVYRDQTCRICLITGNAGSGKTTLIEHFAQFTEEQYSETVVVAIGKCNAQTGQNDTYLPFREIINQFTGIQAKLLLSSMDNSPTGWFRNFTDGALEALIELGPDLIGTFIPGSALVARLAQTAISGTLKKRAESRVGGQEVNNKEVSKQYSEVIRKISNNAKTVILIIDDMQWADEASLQLFVYLTETLKEYPVMLIGTYRSENFAQDHPLRKHILEHEWGFWESTLNLSEGNVTKGREFVKLFLAANKCKTSEQFETVFFERTEGNALFVVELFRYLYDHKYLGENDAGDIVASSEMDWNKLPSQLTKLEGLIQARFEALNAELREILDIACIEGQDFTAQVSMHLLKLPEYDLLRRLSAELEKRHNFVTEVREVRVGSSVLSNYRFVNATFHQYLYTDMSLGQRRLRHKEVAETLETLYGPHSNEIAFQLARHYELSYMPEKVVRYLNLAGQQLARVSEFKEAEAVFNRALSLAKIENDKKGIVDSLRYICGFIWLTQDKDEVAKEQLLEALEQTRNINYIDGEIYILRQLGILARRRKHYTTAARYYLESFDLAKKVAADAKDDVEKSEAKNAMAQALNNLGTAAMAEKAYDDAEGYLTERLKIAVELNNQNGKLFAYINLGDLFWRKGRAAWSSKEEDNARRYWALAKGYVDQALDIANSTGTKGLIASAERNLGNLAISEGNYPQAANHLARSLSIVVNSGITSAIVANLTSVATLLSRTGRPKEAVIFAHFVSKFPKSTEFEQELAGDVIREILIQDSSVDTSIIQQADRDTLAKNAFELLQVSLLDTIN